MVMVAIWIGTITFLDLGLDPDAFNGASVRNGNLPAQPHKAIRCSTNQPSR